MHLNNSIKVIVSHDQSRRTLDYQWAIFSPLQCSETVVLDDCGISAETLRCITPDYTPSFYQLQKASLAELRQLHMTEISFASDILVYALGFAFSD